jgi:predicted transcriptional regulator
LRRELASTLCESGAPDHIVADVLGHASISTTSRYLKASRSGLTAYVHRFEAHRAEQRKAAENAAKKKSRRIRTPFAHAAPERPAPPTEPPKCGLSL